MNSDDLSLQKTSSDSDSSENVLDLPSNTKTINISRSNDVVLGDRIQHYTINYNAPVSFTCNDIPSIKKLEELHHSQENQLHFIAKAQIPSTSEDNVTEKNESVTSPSTREEQDSSVTLMELKNLIIKNNSEQQKQMVRLEETMRVGFEALIETIQKGFQAQSETIQKGFQAQSEAIKEGFQAQSEAIKEGFQAQSETIKEVFEAQTKIIEQLVTTPNTQKIERLERRILELEMKKTSEGTSEDLLWYCGPCDKETDHKSAECFRFGGRTPKED